MKTTSFYTATYCLLQNWNELNELKWTDKDMSRKHFSKMQFFFSSWLLEWSFAIIILDKNATFFEENSSFYWEQRKQKQVHLFFPFVYLYWNYIHKSQHSLEKIWKKKYLCAASAFILKRSNFSWPKYLVKLQITNQNTRFYPIITILKIGNVLDSPYISAFSLVYM